MPIQTICTCGQSLTGFCARDIRECKQLFLTEMDNLYNYEDMEEKKTQNCPICGTPCEVIDEPYQGDKTVDEIWESFWKPIVSNEDGTINIEQVKKELADFSFIMEQVPKVYCHITGNKMSKVMYRADTVIAVADEYFQEQLEEAVKEEKEEQPGAAWVKVSTKPPVCEPVCYAKIKDNLIEGDERSVILCKGPNPDWYIAFGIDLRISVRIDQVIEWLDESGTDTPLTQSRADLIREANNRDLGGIVAVPTAWIRADVKRPDGWQLARFLNSRKRFPVKFSPHVIADMVGKTYEPQELEYLSDEGAAAAGREEDACDFAEWMRLNCKSSEIGWVDALGKWDTTKGWYELFKQNEKQ